MLTTVHEMIEDYADNFMLNSETAEKVFLDQDVDTKTAIVLIDKQIPIELMVIAHVEILQDLKNKKEHGISPDELEQLITKEADDVVTRYKLHLSYTHDKNIVYHYACNTKRMKNLVTKYLRDNL